MALVSAGPAAGCAQRNPSTNRPVTRHSCYEMRMERIVHVCNGDSTADTLSLADLPGEIRVWADALDIGPVLPVDDAEHYKARGAFWATREGHASAADNAKRLAEYDRQLDEAAGAEELILWYEH